MLLDSGLDNAAKYTYNSSTNQSSNYLWVQYAAVGTSGAAPLASQTLLGAEVARTNSHGGFAPTDTFERDALSGVLRGRHTNTRVFNFSAAYNLSEFGFVPTSSGGTLHLPRHVPPGPQRPGLHRRHHQRPARRPVATDQHPDSRG